MDKLKEEKDEDVSLVFIGHLMGVRDQTFQCKDGQLQVIVEFRRSQPVTSSERGDRHRRCFQDTLRAF